MKYQRIMALLGKPWAILPEKLETIREMVRLRAAGVEFTDEEIRLRIGAAEEEVEPYHIEVRVGDAEPNGVIAIIPIHGTISHRMNLMTQISGGTSTDKLTQAFRAAMAEPQVKAILFDVNSPGGSVEGIPELAAEIADARGRKPIKAIANPMMASAAYWLGSAADSIAVIPSGQVGSIGVIAAHEDVSKALEADGIKVTIIKAGKHKGEGNPYEPLSEGARADLQSKVDAFYGMFVKAVARGRRVSESAVKAGFGQGRMVLAAEAVGEKMADKVATFDAVLGEMGAGVSRSVRVIAEETAPIESTDDANAERRKRVFALERDSFLLALSADVREQYGISSILFSKDHWSEETIKPWLLERGFSAESIEDCGEESDLTSSIHWNV